MYERHEGGTKDRWRTRKSVFSLRVSFATSATSTCAQGGGGEGEEGEGVQIDVFIRCLDVL